MKNPRAYSSAILGLLLAWAMPGQSGVLVGQTAPDFSLPGVDGQNHTLPNGKQTRAVVVAFLGTECPLVVNLYATRLVALAKEFQSRGVEVIGIDANAQDSLDDMKAFADHQQIRFPFMKDNGAKVADAFGATRTPEVYLLDEKRIVRYHGRIDDQGRVGYIRIATERSDLRMALEEVLAGLPVSLPELPAVGCLIGRRNEASSAGDVTYARDVAAIFQKRCLDCHRAGEIGPFAMENYDEVAGWSEMIKEVVLTERMPPWFASPEHGHFSNNARLSDQEKKVIADWVDAGAPLGNEDDLPPAKTYTAGWNIGTPDLVVPMADEPFRVPAEGVIGYKHYVVDPGFDEDKWLTACEVRPGDRTVVHHVLVFCRAPGHRSLLDIFNGGLIAAYAPGMPAFQAPEGVARRLPKGSKIVMQMHYTVNGRESEDLSSVGFRFTQENKVQQEIEALAANNFFIVIPPQEPNHQVKAVYHFKDDRLLVNLTPHMHMRGKSFLFEAVYPGGRRETLLDVPRFDFNWQLQYNLAEPKLMPKGTQLICTAHYDNSSANPANPNPNTIVRFGEQTWDEMMIGWFTAMTPEPRVPASSQAAR
jgi:peroxiredoxin